MHNYLRHLLVYVEQVLHPAGGATEDAEKRKRKTRKTTSQQLSPESYHIRGSVKKQDKVRRNPAP